VAFEVQVSVSLAENGDAVAGKGRRASDGVVTEFLSYAFGLRMGERFSFIKIYTNKNIH